MSSGIETSETRFVAHYRTPKGFDNLLMSSDGEVLTGLWFEGSPGAAKHTGDGAVRDLPVFRETAAWLDAYFAGRPPATHPRFRMDGLTPFRAAVVEEMRRIPFGRTVTYGEIAAHVAKRLGRGRMSAQAVGGAVGRNPICILSPCHRVVGRGGALVGYGGGLPNKAALLRHEAHVALAPLLSAAVHFRQYTSRPKKRLNYPAALTQLDDTGRVA